MKKIMFNDKYGLTRAVLDGNKTMTRRIIKCPKEIDGKWVSGLAIVRHPKSREVIECLALDDEGGEISNIVPRYKVGEIVAVAQKYKDFRWPAPQRSDFQEILHSAGWNNKMYVRADLMPYQVRITSIRIERLQDISDDDVYKEGFSKEVVNNGWGNAAYHWEAILVYYDGLGRSKEIRSCNPREAYATLIDKVSGNGTWANNPYVFAYSFELVK